MAEGATRELTRGSREWWDHLATLPEAWRAASWGSEGSQAKRFNALLEALPDPEDGESLLDWGCGQGELRAYWPARCAYTGADPSQLMLYRAAARFGSWASTHWLHIEDPHHPDVRGRFDYVVAIGPFNLEPWDEESTQAVLAKLWGSTRKALAVSVLRGRYTGPGHVVHSPERMLGFVQRLGCDHWRLDAAYLPNDLLVVAYR